MTNIEVVDLYKKTQEDQKFNAEKAWETIKFSVTVFSTLISIHHRLKKCLRERTCPLKPMRLIIFLNIATTIRNNNRTMLVKKAKCGVTSYSIPPMTGARNWAMYILV